MNNLKFMNIEQFLEKIGQIELSPLTILKASSFTLAGIGLVYLSKIWYSYRFFKKRGLKSPKHEFFYGNFRQIYKNKNYSEMLREWTKEYGKTYGYFEGHLPVIVTSDLEFIQEVFIKQSTNFSARKKGFLSRKDDDPNSDLFQSTKGRWKRMRMIMNPTFSSAKLRELGPILVNCADRLIDVLNKEGDAEINVSEYFKRFTMDSIWNCAFGVDINMQNDKENLYLKNCEQFFKVSSNLMLPHYLGLYFHEFKDKIVIFLIIITLIKSKFVALDKLSPYFWLKTKVKDLVNQRLFQKESRKRDYIQLLLEACGELNSERLPKNAELKKSLSPIEVENNLILFMLAGFDTTSTTLGLSCYVLSINSDEQLRLYDEISAVFGTDLNTINYDSVQQFKYLDWFIKEVLRHYPVGNSIVARRCTKKTTIKGIDIPVDTPVAVDVMSIHFDADLWGPQDPNEFYPPRHEVKRNPLAFMAFGNGPRNCIGMKFALIELKIALVKLIMNFEFVSIKKEIEFEEGSFRYPKNGVTLLLRKRI